MSLIESFFVLYVPNVLGYLIPAALIWPKTEKDPAKIFRFWPSVRLTAVNLFLLLPLLCLALVPFFRVKAEFVWWYEILAFAGSFVLAEAWFYVLHRLFHVPRFFNAVHYLHHQVHRPHVIHSGYQHPAEFLTATMGTCLVGPMVIAMHPVTTSIWLFWMMAAGTIAHGGYFPKYLRWFRPHDHHHKYVRQNYGFLFLDLILKTTYRAKKARKLGQAVS